ncbi:MAG TPA: acyl-CoA dehydrogenase family protein [Thermoplasmata archaeon]|nr:acyl-CoA dehydrogenase family protein [Thermoplasmata archaeon]
MTLPPPPVPEDPIEAEIDKFARVHRLAERAVEIDRDATFPAPEFRAMGDAGLLGLHLPERLGGRALPLVRTGIALFHLARRGGTAFAKLSLQPEFASVLADHGSPLLVERHFRPLVQGRHLVGNHITEPGAGSDAAALQAVARPSGDRYLLRGTKSEAAFAADADAAIVYARVPPEEGRPEGITAFLVPQDLAGIRRTVHPDLGERWMRRGTVEYDDVHVPADHVLGEVGKGFEYVKGEFTRERALLAAIYLGVAWSSWEETVLHVGDRAAFGTSLARHEAVGFPLVGDWAHLESVWLYTARVLAQLDGGVDATAPAALAKWMATERALEAIDHAIQFHGGRGYSASLPHERRWRDVRSGRLAHGPSEVMQLVASRTLWGSARKA